MSDDAERQRADRARRLREWAEGEDGLFQIFSQVEAAYLTFIARSEPGDTAKREQTYYRMKALGDLRAAMQAAISSGAGSSKIIDAMAQKAEKKQRKAPNVA